MSNQNYVTAEESSSLNCGRVLVSWPVYVIWIALLVLPLGQNALLKAQLPAFPGAEGFGANATGGRGGTVIEVMNLNDRGPGSLRAAIDANGPRIVVFRVGGTIETLSPLRITSPNITIAGQTAPGGGITIKNHPSNALTTLRIETSNVILRYLRVRPGPPLRSDSSVDALAIGSNSHSVRNVIVDHCSLSWATDEVLSTWYRASDITIQWCIIAEALRDSVHREGPHSMGALLGDQSTRISFHHNLLAHNDHRNPRAQGGDVDIVNNVIYNARATPIRVDDFRNRAPARFNLVGNFFKFGPDSAWSTEIMVRQVKGQSVRAYVECNLGPSLPVKSLVEKWIVDLESRQFLVDERHPFPLVTTTPAEIAYEKVLAEVGATMPTRDAVDERIVSEVRSGKGSIIDHPSEVGGWPNLSSGTARRDSDHDGIPDEWEQIQGLDPRSSEDSGEIAPSGYTWIEEYMNPRSLN